MVSEQGCAETHQFLLTAKTSFLIFAVAINTDQNNTGEKNAKVYELDWGYVEKTLLVIDLFAGQKFELFIYKEKKPQCIISVISALFA